MPTADTPVPRHLSEEERALWETPERCVFERATVRALLTALSTEREAGERASAVAKAYQFGFEYNDDNGAWYDDDGRLVCVDESLVEFFSAMDRTLAAAPSTETPR